MTMEQKKSRVPNLIRGNILGSMVEINQKIKR